MSGEPDPEGAGGGAVVGPKGGEGGLAIHQGCVGERSSAICMTSCDYRVILIRKKTGKCLVKFRRATRLVVARPPPSARPQKAAANVGGSLSGGGLSVAVQRKLGR